MASTDGRVKAPGLPARGVVTVPMRDGAALKTWVYAPDGDDAFPVFMVRNPYSHLNSDVQLEAYAQFFTSRGIALVWQATRGTGGSEGDFVPYVNEVDDAKDTISWLLAQPRCNGRIGVGGGSYLGYTAFAAAAADPHVVVVLSDDTATDEEMTRHGGVVNGYLLSWWSLVERGRPANDSERAVLTNGADPTQADSAVLGRDLPYWNGLLAAGTSVYPAQASVQTLAARLCVPTLHIVEGETPWNDPLLAWRAVGRLSCEREQAHQWLIVAPESHSFHFNAFGVSDTWVTPDMVTMLEAFLLTSAPAPTWPKVRYRIEADEPTQAAPSWPPTPKRTTTYYLAAPGPSGEGTLATTPPAAGRWLMKSAPATTDPCATPTDTWFTSKPLEQDLVLVGAPRLSFEARTQAADYDVNVMLYDYDPKAGEYRSLGLGAVRARYRTGVSTPLPRGGPVTFSVELTSSARRIRAGHALTLAVAPSRCEYAENPHTGEPPDRQTGQRTAQVEFALGPQGARLVLPGP